VFVIDECWKYFPAGARTNDLPKSLQSFLAEHRHYVGADGRTTEVALVTQSLYQLAPFARELVDSTFITSKLDKVGKKGSYRVDVYSGPCNLNRPDPDRLVNQTYGNYRAEVWRFYRSHTHNDSGFASGDEQGTDSRGSVWGSPLVRFGLPGAVLALCLAVWQLSVFLDPDKDRPGIPAQTVPGSTSSPSVEKAPASPPGAVLHVASEPYSDRYRLVGVVYGESIRNGQAVIRDLETGLDRVISMSGACVPLPKLPDQWQCRYFDHLVTFFSGQEKSSSKIL